MLTFGESAREQQVRFRSTSSTISDEARHPGDDKGRQYGYLLALGHEEENLFPTLRGDNGARRFFRERRIKWWRSSRSGDTPGVDIPTRNLASSQVACVNFLLPLADVPDALVALLRAIDTDVQDIVPLRYEAFDSPVELEWVGLSSPLEGGPSTRGAHVTSADALIVAITKAGRCRAYVFEWKYVEEYPVGKWLGEGESGNTRRSRYLPFYNAPDSSFSGAVPLDELLYEPLCQIMRLRLLADKMAREREFGISEAKLVVVCPQDNLAYRQTITSPPIADRFPTAKTIEDVAKLALRDPTGFAMTSPEILIDAVRRANLGTNITDWLAYQKERYGW